MNIGPHLLGAFPRPPDLLDFQAADHLALTTTLPTSKRWANPESVLDQNPTPHCVGFGGAQFSNVLPVDKHETNSDGHAIYYACKVYDGEPGAEDGSNLRSLAKVLRDRGRINTYAFTGNLETVAQWILTKGPVIAATVWTNAMFTPDAKGYITADGPEEGGHCYVLHGYSRRYDRFRLLNNWSNQWGLGGYAFIRRSELMRLSWSEFLCAPELP